MLGDGGRNQGRVPEGLERVDVVSLRLAGTEADNGVAGGGDDNPVETGAGTDRKEEG